MKVSRRTLVGMMGGTAMLPAWAMDMKDRKMEEQGPLFGLVGQMKAQPGKRAELIAILAQGTEQMSGCISYVIAEDQVDEDAIWITEIWTDAEHHAASLKLPTVQASIAAGRPLIAGFDHYFKTRPVAGVNR